MKRLLFILCVTMLALTSHAAGYIACVYSNGILKSEFILASKPVMIFSGDDLIVKVGGVQQLQFTALGTKVTFREDGQTAIDEVGSQGMHQTDSGNVPVFRIDNGSITVSGLAAGEIVTTYAVNGQQYASAKADSNGMAAVPVGKGVVIVKTNGMSFKIINK